MDRWSSSRLALFQIHLKSLNVLFAYLRSNDSIYRQKQITESEQMGFRKHHSCKTAVLKVLNDVGRAMEYNEPDFLILIDFSKAFGIIVHSQLKTVGVLVLSN